MQPISAALRCRDGFTLLEALVAMAVVAIGLSALAWAVPQLLGRSEAEATVSRVAGLLIEARDLAMRKGSAVTLTLPPGGKASIAFEARLIELGSVHISLDGARTGAGTAGIAFLPGGTSTGGRILLSFADERRSVEVDWLTGRISVDP